METIEQENDQNLRIEENGDSQATEEVKSDNSSNKGTEEHDSSDEYYSEYFDYERIYMNSKDHQGIPKYMDSQREVSLLELFLLGEKIPPKIAKIKQMNCDS